MCQHLVQRRIDSHKWCRNCGALKLETGDWELPVNPREPNAILEQQRTRLKVLVEQLDAVLPLPNTESDTEPKVPCQVEGCPNNHP